MPGITEAGATPVVGGAPLWEEHPEAAAILWELAEAHAQQDPTFRTAVAFTRLTAAEALKQLRACGVAGPATLTQQLP